MSEIWRLQGGPKKLSRKKLDEFVASLRKDAIKAMVEAVHSLGGRAPIERLPNGIRFQPPRGVGGLKVLQKGFPKIRKALEKDPARVFEG